ncbi:MAG: peptidase M48, partial [Marivivens sp.]|nr:peptidase M48 [Marivivens sp.]
MMRYLIFVLPILYALAMWHFSSWRLRRELDAKSTELADPALKPVTDKLAKALDIPRVRVFVYEIPQINGLAAPDGRIFITRGFLQKFRSGEVSGEEIASVIAHEMGHV